MPTTIKTNRAEVGKKMAVDRKKADDTDMVICSIKVAFPVTRDQIGDLTGFPAATINAFYNQAGAPLQHASLLMTKRQLLLKGKIARHIPEDQQGDFTDPDKTAPVLDLPKALASDMRFVLDNMGAGFRGTISWKARGDEVEDVEPLLGSKAEIDITFSDPALELQAQGGQVQPDIKRTVEHQNGTGDLADAKGNKGSKTKRTKARGQDAAAGGDADRKDAVIPENSNDDTLLPRAREFILTQETISHGTLQDTFNIGFNRAHQMLEQLRGEGVVGDMETGGWRKVLHKTPPPPPAPAGVGPGFAASARAAARKAPAKAASKARRAH